MLNILFAIIHGTGCLTIILEGFQVPINNIDRAVIKQAGHTCKRKYGKCVKSITKKDDDRYWVICGGSLNNKKETK